MRRATLSIDVPDDPNCPDWDTEASMAAVFRFLISIPFRQALV